MATLVFDIETAPQPLDAFDDFTQAYLTQSLAAANLEPDVYQSKVADLTNTFGLSPFTGTIITIGIYDVERDQRVVYYQSDGPEADWSQDGVLYKTRTEQEMLEDFWEGARSYDVFVTFAGRMFDVPFLAIRSAAYGIAITKDLMEHRYLTRQTGTYHVDLQDQFSYYGALGRKPSLHMCCVALGVASAKAAGVSGGDVAELFRQKKFRDIAQYNARDITATAALYKKWYDYLAPPAFKMLET